MLTVATLLKRHHTKKGEGDRDFWHDLGPDYLAKLHRAVVRFVRPDRFVCLTDSPEVMPDGVEAIPFVRDDPSWWSKLQMFRPGLLSGTVLYTDLDNVIAGPLDELLDVRPDPIVMTDDRNIPGMANGSLMLFDAERMGGVWETYLENPLGIQKQFSVWPEAADQAFLSSHIGRIPLFQEYLPDGYLRNAYSELATGVDWSDTRLVFGCGGSKEGKPHTSTHPFVAEYWR